jgi:hypothetical protein
MQLARFDSAEEQKNFLSILKARNDPSLKNCWLAGNDIVDHGVWKWDPNNIPINFELAWGEGQPGNISGITGLPEHCIEVWGNFLLNDEDCDVKSSFICQRVVEK